MFANSESTKQFWPIRSNGLKLYVELEVSTRLSAQGLHSQVKATKLTVGAADAPSLFLPLLWSLSMTSQAKHLHRCMKF